MRPLTTAPTWFPNHRDANWTAPDPDPRVRDFHRGLDGYAPTPLTELPLIATELGVAGFFAKDESHRLGLPAFKALGASWAIHRFLEEHSARGASEVGPFTLVTASDGNHGRAVARFARRSGHAATIFVPHGVHVRAIEAIRAEGAQVVQVDGNYDDAVHAAAEMAADANTILVQDTARDGYVEVPAWIVDGYNTLFTEIDEQLGAVGVEDPDLIAIPTGVGSLLQAALHHYRHPDRSTDTAVVAVEPDTAASVFASIAAGQPVTVDTATTVMAGLNCGTVSPLAWPAITAGLDGALITTDADATRAAHDLAALGVDAGPCGAAPLAALRAVLAGPDAGAIRHHVGLTDTSTVVVVITEGTDANPVHRTD